MFIATAMDMVQSDNLGREESAKPEVSNGKLGLKEVSLLVGMASWDDKKSGRGGVGNGMCGLE